MALFSCEYNPARKKNKQQKRSLGSGAKIFGAVWLSRRTWYCFYVETEVGGLGGSVRLVMDACGAGPFRLPGLPTGAGGQCCGMSGGGSAFFCFPAHLVLVLGPSKAKNTEGTGRADVSMPSSQEPHVYRPTNHQTQTILRRQSCIRALAVVSSG